MAHHLARHDCRHALDEARLPSEPAVGAKAEEANPTTPVPSHTLLKGRTVVHIEHNGALYQLRRTRLGKLILTK